LTVFEEEDLISTDSLDVPLRKRVATWLQAQFSKVNKRKLAKFGKKAARFINMQFAFVIIAFFVLSVNAINAPLVDTALANPLLDYEPGALAHASTDINAYVPILQDIPEEQTRDQVLSAAVGTETAYVPKPMLVETVDHDTASRVLRGLRRETVQHTVQPGETLTKIATHYGINVATILEENGIDAKDTAKIKPGTQLAIAPENTTDSTDWLDKLHEEERKAREERLKQEQERQTRLAKASSSSARTRLAASAAVAAEPDSNASSGKFRKPIGAVCRNGYHWYAVDCPSPIGSSVFSAAGGVVVAADPSGYNGGYGKTIVISHGNGWETRYAHLNSLNVSVGDRVNAGEVIAASGNTGRSTGPHLHLEIIKSGQRLNPVNFGM
jgi:murein DD-endopeptidase MepM/ murein hydrolase activator NlpD